MKRTGNIIFAAICTFLFCASQMGTKAMALVSPVNLTDEERQWINDTCLKGETVETKDGQFLYKIERDPFLCARVTGYTGDGGDVVFNDYAGFIRVSSSVVDFSERDDITSVTYNGGYHFNGYADDFKNCQSIESLTVNLNISEELSLLYGLDELEEEVKEEEKNSGSCFLIGNFSGCTNLKTITLPHDASHRSHNTYGFYIGKGVFEGCTSLEELDVSGCWKINAEAFLNCTALKKVVFDENVVGIDDYAFGYTMDEKGNYHRYDDITIYGAAGTEAEQYAAANDIPFVNLGRTGDIDESGDVDVSDAVLLARFLAEDPDAEIGDIGRKYMDVNNDGKKDSDDVTSILRMILNGH